MPAQPVVLFGESLEHVLRPLARHLGVQRFIANRMEFRDGVATGRLLAPVVHPRGSVCLDCWRIKTAALGRPRCLRNLVLPRPQPNSSRQPRPAGRALSMQPPSVVPFDGAPSRGGTERAAGSVRQTHPADRRHRLHRQSLDGRPARADSGHRQDYAADSA